MDPITLEGQYVRLTLLLPDHEDALVQAASDGELWNSTVTIVPTPETMAAYIQAALDAQARGDELPFAINQKSTNRIVGTTRSEPRTGPRQSAIPGWRRVLNARQ